MATLTKVIGLLEEEIKVMREGSEYSFLTDWEARIGEAIFFFAEHEDLKVEDQGKFSSGGTIYELMHEEEVNGEKEIHGTGIYYLEPWSRSGSYFSSYYYEHERPYRVMKQPKMILIEEWEEV